MPLPWQGGARAPPAFLNLTELFLLQVLIKSLSAGYSAARSGQVNEKRLRFYYSLSKVMPECDSLGAWLGKHRG